MIDEKKIINQKFKKISYSEVNNHKRNFYYDGFDTFDFGINFQMENDYCWNLSWGNQEYFEVGEGYFYSNKYINPNKVKIWEATERWNNILNYKLKSFKINFIDDACFIVSDISLEFENGIRVIIIIGEELNINGTIPFPLHYEFNGCIYVFHDEKLLLNT